MKHPILMRRAAAHGRALTLAACVLATASFALTAPPVQAQVSIGVSVTVGSPPPPLPVYDQPPIPGDGYIWVPGYWAWDGSEYYWVPGTWVLAPFTGALWTPGYWGWSDGAYVFHQGYWGPEVGYYGGIDYGYGYTGVGYEGGHWERGGFYYNRAVNNISNVHITNVYNKTVINNVTVNRVSYNGGNGGVHAQPTPQQVAYEHAHHTPPVAAQQQHMQMARQNPQLRFTANHGAPPIAATARPAAFTGGAIAAARGAPSGGGNGPRPGAGARPEAGPRPQPQPTGNRGLPSEHFAPHTGRNANEAPREPVTPQRPEERSENLGAPHTPRPEAAPSPRESPAPREAPTPREMAPERPAAQPQQPAFRGAPPSEAHPSAPPPHPAERQHPAPAHENGGRREDHPPGG
jgi:hypothetical protein